MPPDAERSSAAASTGGGKKRVGLVRAFVLTVVVVVIALLVLLVVTPAQPKGDASAVSAVFVGYTNNPAGSRVAIFTINNRSPFPVRRQWYYEIQLWSGSTWAPQPTVRLPYGLGPVIRPGESEVWTIKAPMIKSRWRVVFPYVEDESWIQKTREKIRVKSERIGLRIPSRSRSYAGFSDDVDQ